MDTTLIVAVISAIGTMIGSLSGILISNRLTNYRIQQLEKKVDEHNRYALRLPVVEEQIKTLGHRIKSIEDI